MPETRDLSKHRQAKATNSLWKYSAADGYQTPEQPAAAKVKMGLSSFLKRFWPGDSKAAKAGADNVGPPLPEALMTELLPAAHWDAATASLTECLNPWLNETKPKSLVQAVIGPPGSGVRQVVSRWGTHVSGKIVSPPDYEIVMNPKSDFWQDIAGNANSLIVIPELERFYLRHSDGLELIRQLTQWLWHSPHRVVIGCSSWAWAYLSHTLRINAVFQRPIALESLDGEALQAWFRPRPRGRYLVHSAASGEVIYPMSVPKPPTGNTESQEVEDEEPEAQGADIFQRIAADSRGIPEVALALWSQCLCEEDDEQDEAKSPSKKKRLATDGMTPIGVRPPQNLALPSIPDGTSTRDAIILHTLLLHAGLPSSILFTVVPFPQAHVMTSLSALRAAGLVYEVDEIWQVAPLAYTRVRSFVKSETLLIDLF